MISVTITTHLRDICLANVNVILLTNAETEQDCKAVILRVRLCYMMQCKGIQERLIAKEENIQHEKGQQNIHLRSCSGFLSRGNHYDHPNLISSKTTLKASPMNSFTVPTILTEFEQFFKKRQLILL